jgi:hypothetical protein
LKELDEQLRKYKKNLKEKNLDPEDESKNQWGMVNLIGRYLLFIGTLDFTA